MANTTEQQLRIAPRQRAYVRGGEWVDKNWLTINREEKLDTNNAEILVLKYGDGDKFSRRVLLTFDLSEIAKIPFRRVVLNPSYTRVGEALSGGRTLLHLYKISPNWQEDTVTWSNRPETGECVCRGALVSALCWPDLTEAVKDALAKGESQLSILLEIETPTKNECRLNAKTLVLIATTAEEVAGCQRSLVPDEAENAAIWAWAENLYDEWNERYQGLLAQKTKAPALIPTEPAHYTKTVRSGGSGFAKLWTMDLMTKEHPTRTYEALEDLGQYSDYNAPEAYDEYGGLIDEAMRREARGFFYSEKLDGRWWIIDPLGYPCHIRAVSGVGINYCESPHQRQAALARYGTEEGWAEATVKLLHEELGFNLARTSSSAILHAPNRMINQLSAKGFAAGYGRRLGSNASVGGSTVFSENNTMNVFDPDFVTFADENAQALAEKRDDPWVLGYTTDNELPMDPNMLFNYLSLNTTKAINHYSYAAAWTWLKRLTGKENPSAEDVTPEVLQLFRGFVWDRYYNVVTTAFRRYDPNHMILGTRFLTGVKNAPWVLRFASLYLDGMTINWYGQWEPKAEDLQTLCENADLPLMVTEFYTKAMDSGLGNTRGAGWVVPTQQDRGNFYQGFTLRLLECKNFIGWHWFQYIDCDPSPVTIYRADGRWKDQSSIDANKGLVDNGHRPYRELTDAMADINKNVYRLIRHFDAKYAEK